jgi:hypothetical protein
MDSHHPDRCRPQPDESTPCRPDDRGSVTGHHGLNNGNGGDNLFIGFDIRTTMQHDLTSEWYATGVVFTRGRGDNLRMDHHCAAPYTTLWTENAWNSTRK